MVSHDLELVTGATGATGAAEVVARPALGPPIPHAPGARMTAVTQTPSNYVIYIYIYVCVYIYMYTYQGTHPEPTCIKAGNTSFCNKEAQQSTIAFSGLRNKSGSR